MSIFTYFQEQQKFKRLILKAQKAEFIKDVKDSDKLGLKYYTYVTGIILANATAGAIYAIKKQTWKKGINISLITFFVSYLFYSAYYQWEIRIFVSALQRNQHEIAYWFRKKTLEQFKEHWAVKNRIFILNKLNQRFQKKYLIDQ